MLLIKPVVQFRQAKKNMLASVLIEIVPNTTDIILYRTATTCLCSEKRMLMLYIFAGNSLKKERKGKKINNINYCFSKTSAV